MHCLVHSRYAGNIIFIIALVCTFYFSSLQATNDIRSRQCGVTDRMYSIFINDNMSMFHGRILQHYLLLVKVVSYFCIVESVLLIPIYIQIYLHLNILKPKVLLSFVKLLPQIIRWNEISFTCFRYVAICRILCTIR